MYGWVGPRTSSQRRSPDWCPILETPRQPPGMPSAALDFTAQPFDDRVVLRTVRLERWTASACERPRRRGQVLTQLRGHHVQPRDRVVVGLGDTSRVPFQFTRVGDQRDGALVGGRTAARSVPAAVSMSGS